MLKIVIEIKRKKVLLSITLLIVVGLLYLGWRYVPVYIAVQQITPDTAPADYALQDDTKVVIPA